MSDILVNVTRGNAIESIHRGHIVVVNSKGDILYQLGNPDFNICLRSCAKPLQALPIITTGAADTFSFTPAELAVMSGSLNGQDFQVNTIKSILNKIGLDERALQCGIHRPSHRATAKKLQEEGRKPSPLHNNCAGKHTAMLALCVHHGWSLDNYISNEHPVQQLIVKTVSSMAEVPIEKVGIGIDGCGVPVFFLPLKNLATSYAKLTSTSDQDIHRLMEAILSHPEMIAGDERICTDIMRALGKKVFAKTGAEGGYAMSLMEKGWGVAIKIEDGNNRAIQPVTIEALKQLDIITKKEEDKLQTYHHPVIKNHRKETVGSIAAQFSLTNQPS
ncbi:MAG: asparaginase [Deltaproteobacteria bacterium]|jgi:L-asparaginase II|nr:asparaginase [Deltaproteobacteria bacterium]